MKQNLNQDSSFIKIGNEFIFNAENTIRKGNFVFINDFKNNPLLPIKSKNDNKFAFIDKFGNLKLKWFDQASNFYHGLAIVKKGSYTRLINTSGQFSGDHEFRDIKISFPFSENIFAYVTKDNILAWTTINFPEDEDTYYFEKDPKERAFYDVDDNGIEIRPKYSNITDTGVFTALPFTHVRSPFSKDQPIFKYISYLGGINGNILIKNLYGKKEKYSIITYYGNFIVDLDFQEVTSINDNGLFCFKKNKLWGVYDLGDSHVIIQPTYKSIEKVFYHYTIVQNKYNEYGIIDKENHSHVPFGDFIIERLKSGFLLFTLNQNSKTSQNISFITDQYSNCLDGDCTYLNK